MAKQDVTVVGASAAGLFLSESLAHGGLSVSVLERAPIIDPAPRTLIVTSRVHDVLGAPLEPSIVNTIDTYELVADGQRTTIALDEADVVIERSTLIKTLASRAKQAGARLHLGSRFLGIHPTDDGLIVKSTQNAELHEAATKVVVGADGVHSAVARGSGWPPVPTVPVLQAIVALPEDLPPNVTRVWFRPQETPYFYWLIPDGPRSGALGLIADEPRTARLHLDRFLAKEELLPLAYQSARIPMYSRWVRPHRRLGGGDVFLVGDAAGHVKVSTVGGIHTGFRGARAIADLLTNADGRELGSLRRELGRHLLVRRALNRFTEDDYRRLLRLLGDGPRAILGRHSRDDSSTLLWRLAMREPRLVLLGLRGLLTRERRGQAGPAEGRRARALSPQPAREATTR